MIKQEELDYQFLDDSANGLEGPLSMRQLEHKLSQISIDLFKE